MKKLLSFALICFLALPMQTFATAKTKADKDTKEYRYDIECAGNGTTGTYLVYVWSYSKKANVAEEQCRKNAVHGVIFKGFAGGNGCIGQRAMTEAGAELQFESYFKSFFAEGGEFQKYASVIPGTTVTEKIGKEYRVGMTVTVRKDDLRRALEEAGIVKKLNSGF